MKRKGTFTWCRCPITKQAQEVPLEQHSINAEKTKLKDLVRKESAVRDYFKTEKNVGADWEAASFKPLSTITSEDLLTGSGSMGVPIPICIPPDLLNMGAIAFELQNPSVAAKFIASGLGDKKNPHLELNLQQARESKSTVCANLLHELAPIFNLIDDRTVFCRSTSTTQTQNAAETITFNEKSCAFESPYDREWHVDVNPHRDESLPSSVLECQYSFTLWVSMGVGEDDKGIPFYWQSGQYFNLYRTSKTEHGYITPGAPLTKDMFRSEVFSRHCLPGHGFLFKCLWCIHAPPVTPDYRLCISLRVRDAVPKRGRKRNTNETTTFNWDAAVEVD